MSMCADNMKKMLLQSIQPIIIFVFLTCVQMFQVKGQCVNQLGVIKNGKTCVQLNPRECYDATVLSKCCQSCTAINTGVTGCEYGDKVANCIVVLCTFYTDINECCATCKLTTTAPTPSPSVTTIAKTAILLRTIATTTIKRATPRSTIATRTKTATSQSTIATTTIKRAIPRLTIATTAKTTTSQPTIATTKIKRTTPRPTLATTAKTATSQSTIAPTTIKRATARTTAAKVTSATSSLQMTLLSSFLVPFQPYVFMYTVLVIISLHFAIKFTIDYE